MGPAAVTDQMPCPLCGAMIEVRLPKCPSCGEFLIVDRLRSKWLPNLWPVLLLLAIGAVLVALCLPAVSRTREAPRRTQCRNNLKQIGIALHQYVDDWHALPPAYTVDSEGKPLHSWRTLILPYLDEAALYEKIDLSKPWNDLANAEACNTALAVYCCPSYPGPRTHTTYLASVGAKSCFHPTRSRPFSEITDGLAETLMVIEVAPDDAVPWMSPADADESLVLTIGGQSKLDHLGGTHAALGDGSVRFLSTQLSEAQRRALISIDAGDHVGDY